jgi:hypothetical protein
MKTGDGRFLKAQPADRWEWWWKKWKMLIGDSCMPAEEPSSRTSPTLRVGQKRLSMPVEFNKNGDSIPGVGTVDPFLNKIGSRVCSV